MRNDTLVYGAAVFLERVLGLLLLPLLTRHLTPEQYGLWTQTAVVSNLLMPIVLLGLPTAIARHLARGVPAAAQRRLMLQSLAGVALALLLFALPVLALREPAARWAYGTPAARDFVAILLLVLACDALVDLLTAFWRAAAQLRRIAALLLARALLRVGLMAGALALFGWSFERAFALLALLQLALVAMVLLLGRASVGAEPAVGAIAADGAAPPAETAPRWGQLLRFGLPLALGSLLNAAHNAADRFVLTQQLGLAPLAAYSAAVALVWVGAMAYNILGFTLLPELARRWHEGDRAADLAARTLQLFWFLALPVVVCLGGVGDRLLPLIATAHYQVEPGVWLLLGITLLAYGTFQIALYLLLLADRGYDSVGLLALALAVNVVLNLLWVPVHGLLGAAGAAAASNLLLALTGLLRSRRLWSLPRLGRDAAALLLRAALAFAALAAVRAAWPASLVAPLAAALLVYGLADLATRASLLRSYARLAR